MKIRKIREGLALLFLVSSAWAVDAPIIPTIKSGEILPLERCISIALAYDPDLQGLAFAADAAHARVAEARSGYLPSANAQAGFIKNESIKLNPNDPYVQQAVGTFNSKAASVSVNQLLFDFGRTGSAVKKSASQWDAAKARYDFQKVLISFSVKQAYYSVLQTRRVRNLRQEMVKQYQEHLDVAQAMFHAGTRPRYYVTKAETDLSSAELDLIKAENDLQVAIVVLANTMNIANPPPYDIVDNLDYEHYDAALDDIMSKAYSGRQDLKAYNLDAEAAKRSLSFFRSDLYPSLNASGGYGASGTRNPLSQGWNAGVNLTASLFTGLLKISRVTEAEKSWRQAQTQIESLRLQISLDAHRSFLDLKRAEKSIDTAKHGVEQAKENLDIATISYKVGSGTPLDVTDATVLFSNATIDLIGALYDYKIAKASIEKTMGYQ